ncbi:protein claret segregational-like [Anopheles albimanus]|uniref:Kinesin-like protein n=1 Tax=Anopheles albimanus TaxID=7167 RepID=A0A182FSW8_ANOAL|nr:protein claret segregational-like [Anopheles albimanus]
MDSKIPKPSFLRKPVVNGALSLPGNARLPLSRDLLNLPQTVSSTLFAVAKVRAPSPEQRHVNGGMGRPEINRTKLRRSRSVSDLTRKDFHRPKHVPSLSKPGKINATTVALMASSNLLRQVSANTDVQGRGDGLLRRSRSFGDLAMKSNLSHASTTSSSTSSSIFKRPPTSSNGSSGVPAKLSKMTTGPAAPSQAGLFKSTGQKSAMKPAGGAVGATAMRKAPLASKVAGTINRTVGTGKIGATVTSGPKVANGGATSGAAKQGAAKSMNKRIPPYDYKARFAHLQEKHKTLVEKYEKLHEQHASRETLQDMYDECSQELDELKQRHEQLLGEMSGARDEKRSLEESNAQLSAALERSEADLKLYRDKYAATSKELAELKRQLAELEERSNFLETENVALQETNERNAELLFQANIERKDLHNMVMDLRGNIRVFCRVRPPLMPSEEHRIECGWKYLDEQSLELLAMDGSGKRHEFSFDHVFHARTRQEDIFENVSPLIQSALDGYNVCIFAYGQTGSGKTYTMDGVPDNLGVIPRTVDLIFNAINDYKRFGWEYEIRVNFLEIYNEVLYDLLDTTGTTKELEIKMASAKSKTEVYVSNIIEETVESPARLHQLMSIAKMNRATAATAGNERSSRSHAVTKIMLIGTHREKCETCIGSVNLVDLAGSESPKTSTRMDETKNINRSLSELSNVILALVQRHDHVPYRNSKLTHLLMPSLGGNSKTLMFVNVAPFQDCLTETVKSLRFASQVNSCKMQKVRKNKVLSAV